MTVMRDKLKQAGIDTSGAELYAKACEFLRTPATAPKKVIELVLKRRDMLDALVRTYLASCNADMKAKASPVPSAHVHSIATVAADLATTTTKLVTAIESGQDMAPVLTAAKQALERSTLSIKMQPDRPPSSPAPAADKKGIPQTVVPYKRRTLEQMQAANEIAADIYAMWIGDRQVGSLAWGELDSLCMAMARKAGTKLEGSLAETIQTIFLYKIKEHAVVQDHATKVAAVVPQKTLERYYKEACKEAPFFLKKGVDSYVEILKLRRTG